MQVVARAVESLTSAALALLELAQILEYASV